MTKKKISAPRSANEQVRNMSPEEVLAVVIDNINQLPIQSQNAVIKSLVNQKAVERKIAYDHANNQFGFVSKVFEEFMRDNPASEDAIKTYVAKNQS